MALSALVYALHSSKGCGNIRGFYVNSLQLAWHNRTGCSSSAPTMPRTRGRPQRGAGWYAAASRRKRHQKFSQEIRLAWRKHRTTAAAALSPPGTLVEEDLSITLPADFSESWMFLVPDDWNPPMRFGHYPTPHSPSIIPQPPTDLNATYEACIVLEETLDTTIEEQSHGTTQGRKTSEQGPSRAKLELERSLPPSPQLLHPEHLRLIFEVCSLVDDQAFCAMRLSQRLDMLYAAYSKATPRHQCPTYAQPFVFPGNDINLD